MERLAAARALTSSVVAAPHPAAVVHRYTYALAGPEDDDDVRRLLREAEFPGAVRLAFERGPDSATTTALAGDVYQTIIARHMATSAVAATATRSVRQRFVNGEAQAVGYLSQLRIGAAYRRHRRLLDAGFDFCHRLHDEGAARLYFASVVADNASALKLLKRLGPAWPRFEPIAQLTTLAIPVRHNRQASPAARAVRSNEDVEQALACLWRNGRRYQFSPVWRATVFDGSTPGLSRTSLRVVERGDRIVGCAALWDQRAQRQVVVRGYSRALAMSRWLVNSTARWSGVPTLPPVGDRLEFGYVSHLAVDDDDPEVACGLIAAVCELARNGGLDYVVIGLPRGAPLTAAVETRFRHRSYASVLHLAFWPDGAEVVNTLDGRPCYPELATI